MGVVCTAVASHAVRTEVDSRSGEAWENEMEQRRPLAPDMVANESEGKHTQQIRPHTLKLSCSQYIIAGDICACLFLFHHSITLLARYTARVRNL